MPEQRVVDVAGQDAARRRRRGRGPAPGRRRASSAQRRGTGVERGRRRPSRPGRRAAPRRRRWWPTHPGRRRPAGAPASTAAREELPRRRSVLATLGAPRRCGGRGAARTPARTPRRPCLAVLRTAAGTSSPSGSATVTCAQPPPSRRGATSTKPGPPSDIGASHELVVRCAPAPALGHRGGRLGRAQACRRTCRGRRRRAWHHHPARRQRQRRPGRVSTASIGKISASGTRASGAGQSGGSPRRHVDRTRAHQCRSGCGVGGRGPVARPVRVMPGSLPVARRTVAPHRRRSRRSASAARQPA